MPKLPLILAILMLMSSSMNAMAWEYSQANAPADSETVMMDMADHCDHEESSSNIQDCLNHCATLVALLVNSIQQESVLVRSFEFEFNKGSPLSRPSSHWRPPSQIS